MAGQIYCKSCGKKNVFEIVKPARCSCGNEFAKVLKTETSQIKTDDFEERVKRAVLEELVNLKRRGGRILSELNTNEEFEGEDDPIVINKPRPKIPSSWFKVTAAKHMTFDKLSQQSESIGRQE